MSSGFGQDGRPSALWSQPKIELHGFLTPQAKWSPRSWPLRYTLVHWSAVLVGLPPGAYDLRCRSIDQNGIAQPMPRPFAKSGRAEIQTQSLEVVDPAEAAPG